MSVLTAEVVAEAIRSYHTNERRTLPQLIKKIDEKPPLLNQIRVTSEADLVNIDSTKEYFIDGTIVLTGAVSIEIPSTGIAIRGYNFDTSRLVCTAAAYKLFTSPVGGSGNLLIENVDIVVSGASSQVYDLTGATGLEAIELYRVNFSDCSSLGVVENYRQGLEVGTGRFGGTPNLTLDGEWVGGYKSTTTIARFLSSSMTGALFQAGATFSMNSRFFSDINLDLPANAAFIDFAPSHFPNPNTLQIQGAIISRDGVVDATDANITPNITATDLPTTWYDNVGLPPTLVGGALAVSAEAATVISNTTDFYPINGTWVTSSLVHFDSPSNGQLKHLGSEPTSYEVYSQMLLESTANNELELRLAVFRDSSSTTEYEKVMLRKVNQLIGSRDVAEFSYYTTFILNQNDYAYFEVKNTTSTANVTAELDSFWEVKARVR